MTFIKTLSRLAEYVFNKTLIAFPFLIFGFIILGVKHEHGDINAGLMYPIVFILPSLAYSAACYIIYFIADHLTKQTKWNSIKYVGHLVLAIALIWLDPTDVTFMVLSITLGIVTLINISMAILNYLYKS